VNEDALPAMPSWDTARSRRVADMEEREEDGGAIVGGDDAGAEEDDIALGRMGSQHQPPQQQGQGSYNQRQPTLPRISAGAEAEEYAHLNHNQRNIPLGGDAQREQYGNYYNNITDSRTAYNTRPPPPILYNARAPAPSPAPQSPFSYSYSYYAPERAQTSESYEHRVPRMGFGNGFYEPMKRAPAPPEEEARGGDGDGQGAQGLWYPPPVGQQQQHQQPRER